jgi:DNA-binding NarL/FixJ family response regulator
MNAGATGTSQCVRTVLADRESTIRDALRVLTTQGLGMQVVGEAADATILRQLVRTLRPDLVIVAWSFVVASAGVLLNSLRCSCSGLRVVVLGLRPEIRAEALAAGADGYICMVDAPDVVTAVLLSAGVSARSLSKEAKCGRPQAGGLQSKEPGGLS